MASQTPSDSRRNRGRGSAHNPPNRFQPLHYEPLPPDEWADDAAETPLATRYFEDASRTIITRNDSPDLGFDASINVYRGCEHGCIYCYARPTHEYLDLSPGLDFESRIFVKTSAPELLRRELAKGSWEPTPLAMSGVTDPYQPIERHLKLTRRCLEILNECRQPVAIVTKSGLVTRDIDLLAELAQHDCVKVVLSLTTLDPELARRLEPRAAQPARRLQTIEKLATAGIPVGVLAAPVIPGLTDEELPGLLGAAAEAGARSAGYVALRLPHGVADLFQDWLQRHYPDRASRVLDRLRDMRGGKLYDSTWGTRMTGTGIYADIIRHLFERAVVQHRLDQPLPPLSTKHFRPPAGERQPWLF